MSARMGCWLARTTVLFLILLMPAALPSASQAQVVTLADDAYHYPAWAGGGHDLWYTEWWYFNLVDARRGTSAIFSYFVSNPAGVLAPARVQVVAVAYTDAGTVTAIDKYSMEAFAAATEQADVVIGECTIEVIDADSYRIVGASLDGRLEWDLLYVRSAASWFAGERIPVGRQAWERMSWLIYMPRARVSGWLVVDGRRQAVDATGYHDHNWGEWVPTAALWRWGQYSNPELAFELGDFRNQPAGVASIDIGGERTVFNKEQYSVVHTRWAFDPTERAWYPTESLFVGDDGRRRLWIRTTVLETVPLRGALPGPLPDLIIFEQTARYDGRLWTKAEDGAWRLDTVFRGQGFTEYTAKQY